MFGRSVLVEVLFIVRILRLKSPQKKSLIRLLRGSPPVAGPDARASPAGQCCAFAQELAAKQWVALYWPKQPSRQTLGTSLDTEHNVWWLPAEKSEGPIILCQGGAIRWVIDPGRDLEGGNDARDEIETGRVLLFGNGKRGQHRRVRKSGSGAEGCRPDPRRSTVACSAWPPPGPGSAYRCQKKWPPASRPWRAWSGQASFPLSRAQPAIAQQQVSRISRSA